MGAYEVDALSVYGGGVNYTQATIEAALNAIGTTNKVTMLLRPGSWAIITPLAIPTNETLSMPAGSYFTFSGTGAVTFSQATTVYPEQFAGSDYGVQINYAIASIKSVGGKVVFSHGETFATPINATNINIGITFEGTGTSFSTGPKLIGTMDSVLFDCTGSQRFRFVGFDIQSTTAKVGFLLARNSTGGDAGSHTFTNVGSGYLSSFSVAPVYMYGSEVNSFFSCYFTNNYPGGKIVVSTGYNILSLTSPYATIATGSLSNICNYVYGGEYLNKGGAGSDIFYLEAAPEWHFYGGWWYSASASENGRALVYVDHTNSSSNFVTLEGITGETSTFKQDYGVLFSDAAQIPISWAVNNCRIDAAVAVLYAPDLVQMYRLSVNNTYGVISIYTMRDCTINSGSFTLRTGGTSIRDIISTDTAPTISGSSTYDIITNRAAGDTNTAYGYFHYRGYPTAVDYAVGDLTTNGTWQSLDLSSIVDSGAKTVLLGVQVADDAAASIIQFQDSDTNSVVNLSQIATQVDNISVYADMIVPLTSARVLYYKASNLTFSTINIVVRGWWK
jgi:hypothetical protein